MDLHTFFEAVGSIGLIAAAGFLWKVSAKFAIMSTDITEMKLNHLPHLSEDIGKVSDKLDRHIEWHATGGKK